MRVVVVGGLMDWSDSENPADANKAVFREGYTHVLRAGLAGWLSSLLLAAPVVNHLQRAREAEVVGKTEVYAIPMHPSEPAGVFALWPVLLTPQS